jgi:hypothetical protein
MLCGEIIAVCSDNHTKHADRLCGQNVGILNIKPGGTYSNNWVLEELLSSVQVVPFILHSSQYVLIKYSELDKRFRRYTTRTLNDVLRKRSRGVCVPSNMTF